MNSPRSKTNKYIRGQKISNKIRKTLVFHHALIQGIRGKNATNKGEKKRQLIQNVIGSQVIRRYSFTNWTECFRFL